jgi:D-threo-aldose 1-dehydrogenase
LKQNQIADTEMYVSQFGFGGGSLGDPNEVISEYQSLDTLDSAHSSGVRFYDTAPWYGNGKSEHRLGTYLRNQPRDSFVLNTKVGKYYTRPKEIETFHQDRWLGGFQFELNFDYTEAGFERSYCESLLRLSMTRVDSLVIHDLDHKFHPEEGGVEKRFRELLEGGGFAYLKSLKARGEIKAIGVGVNFAELMPRFMEYCDIDFFLIAMPYTLLDQPALQGSLPLCEKNGISVVSGAVFASGILATGVDNNPLYGYRPAEDKVITRVRSIEQICNRYNVPLGAVALQFPLGHPSVKAVIPGMNSPEIVKKNLEWFQVGIPSDLWSELKEEGLLGLDVPVPEGA